MNDLSYMLAVDSSCAQVEWEKVWKEDYQGRVVNLIICSSYFLTRGDYKWRLGTEMRYINRK